MNLDKLNECENLRFYIDTERYGMTSIGIDIYANDTVFYTLNLDAKLLENCKTVDDIVNIKIWTNEGMDRPIPQKVQNVFLKNKDIINEVLKNEN